VRTLHFEFRFRDFTLSEAKDGGRVRCCMADRPSLTQKVVSAITGQPPPKRTISGVRRAVDARSRFRRIEATVYCRPAGLPVFSRYDQAVDVSRGGVCVYSDEALDISDRLTVELFLRDQPSVTFDAEVAWIEPVEGEGVSGKYDVGLKFLRLSPENEALLSQVLATEE
jgi:hypothetical protein